MINKFEWHDGAHYPKATHKSDELELDEDEAKECRCPSCGMSIPMVATRCPYCRVRKLSGQEIEQMTKQMTEHPIAFFTGVLMIIVMLVFGLVAPVTPDESNLASSSMVTESVTTVKTVPTIEIGTDELIKALNENALKASITYKNKIVKLTGRLTSIDAQGKYFALGPIEQQYTFYGVQCTIDKNYIDTVLNFINDQSVTVTGQITGVGEVLGYTLEVDTIEE